VTGSALGRPGNLGAFWAMKRLYPSGSTQVVAQHQPCVSADRAGEWC
jgi:hypothetical protein